jgi:hypothetical protein
MHGTRKKTSLTWWTLCGLGAVDGLMVGFVIEGFRLVYERHRIEIILREAEQRNLLVGYLMNPALDLLIPIISILAFTLMTPLVFRYLRGRPRFLLLLWIALAMVAMSAGYFMATGSLRDPLSLLSLGLFAGLSYVVFRLWRDRPGFLPFFAQVIGVSTVLVVAAIVQIISLFSVQRIEVRKPLTWLLLLIVVLVVNFICGIVMRLGFSQNSGNAIHVYN